MDVLDNDFLNCLDWEPSYLAKLFSEDFNSVDDLWREGLDDKYILGEVEKMEKYCPEVGRYKLK